MGPIDPRQLMLLRGAVPMPQVQRGTMMQPPMPYQTGAGTQLATTFAEFLSGYANQQKTEKAQAAQDVERDFTLMKMGVPIDQKKTLQNMKKAGINIDTETSMTTPMPMMGQGMGAAPQGNPMEQARPLPQATMAAPTQTLQPPSTVPPQPQQGLWDKFKASVGLGPEPDINMNSAAATWLDRYQGQQQKRAQMEEKLADVKYGAEYNQSLYLQGLFSPDPTVQKQAVEMGKAANIIKTTPFEDFRAVAKMQGWSDQEAAGQWLGIALGRPAIIKAQMDMAEKLAPKFGNDLAAANEYVKDIYTNGKSDLKPGLDFDEKIKIRDQANRLMEIYPTMPNNMAEVMAMNTVVGDKKVAGKIQELLSMKDEKTGWSAFPTQGQLNTYKMQKDLNNDQIRLNQTWAAQQLQREQMAQTRQQHIERATLDLYGMVQRHGGEKFQQAMALYKEAGSGDQKNEALKLVAEAMNNMGGFDVPVPGTGGAKTVRFEPAKVSTKEVGEWIDWLSGDVTDNDLMIKTRVSPNVTGGEKKPKVESSGLSKFFEELGNALPGGAQPMTGLGAGMPPNPFLMLPAPAFPNQYGLPGTPFVNRTQQKPGGY